MAGTGVSSTHMNYDRLAPKWKRMRDCIAGQDSIHAARDAYLPKLKAEAETDYASRLKRSDFFNGTWRTIAGLGGMAFRKPPTVDVPKKIEPYLADVTMAGVSMEGLARDALDEILGPGRVGLLVDHPSPPENVAIISVDAAERLGLRPTLQLYPAESITNWKFGRVANAWCLVEVRLKESVAVPKDEWTEETITQYRVLDLAGGTYRQRLFRKPTEKGKAKDEFVQFGPDIVPLMNGQPLDFVPFAIIGADGLGDAIDEPPLIDLGDANLALYQINSIYRHTLYFCPPTFFIAGYTLQEGETLSVGGTSALVFPDPNAKADYAEPDGNMVPELRAAMQEKKLEMALLGARMIADETSQAETLGATQIKRQGENSVLARIVQSTSAGLEWALGVFAKWAGADGEIVYQINRDFLPAGMDAQQFNAYLNAVAQGEMTSEEFFALMQRADLIDPDIDFEAHREKLDSAGPVRPKVEPNPGVAA